MRYSRTSLNRILYIIHYTLTPQASNVMSFESSIKTKSNHFWSKGLLVILCHISNLMNGIQANAIDENDRDHAGKRERWILIGSVGFVQL